VNRFFDLVGEHIGLERVPLFHFNDTQIPLGGHKDRHWHIGDGMIGIDGFRALVSHAGVRDKVAILETPGTEEDDVRNLRAIRMIVDAVAA
jgi:deoxyribonuclease-4